ncbi:MAG: flagellar export chaperone FliS [Thermodesulfobacteriota bacterium]
MNSYGQRQYKQTQVTTVDKGRLIVLLYEGAIKFLRQARECQEQGDLPGKTNAINRALDIIGELNQSLNMGEGGEMAVNLRQLYLFWSDHLLRAKIKKDIKSLDEVIGMLTSLCEAWDRVASQSEAQEAVPKNEGKSLRAQITV